MLLWVKWKSKNMAIISIDYSKRCIKERHKTLDQPDIFIFHRIRIQCLLIQQRLHISLIQCEF